MDFGFSEAQESFRQTVREFVETELLPTVEERAKLDYIPKEVVKKLGAAGLIGVNLPAEYGGRQADWMSLGIVCEEIGRVDTNLTSPMFFTLGAYLALKAGTEEQRREWLPALIAGEKSSCIAVTEPGCGSDAAAIRTRAVLNGDHYVINGEKTCITRGMQADATLLFAKTDPQAGARGVTCFMLPLDLKGIDKAPIPHAGLKPAAPAALRFDEVCLPERYRIGKEGAGFYIVMGAFDVFRALLSLNILSQAHATVEETISYAKQHKSFGQPLSRSQAVTFKLAEAATLIDAAKFLSYRALWLREQGLPHSKESAMAKWYSTEVAARTIRDMVTLRGIDGYSDSPLRRRLMDAIGFEIFEGPPQIQKTIIARELVGRAG